MFPQDDEEQDQQTFPTDELRRRQMLDIMAPGVEDAASGEDLNVGDIAGPVKPDNAQMSPAMHRYSDVMSSMPKPADYKPSIARRLGAALVGAGVGWRDPKAGVQAAAQVNQAPYNQAMQGWQNQEQSAMGGLKIDQMGQQAQLGQQRAQAAQMSAQARAKAAQAQADKDAWQESQPQPWKPTTKEDAMDFEASKRGPTKPSQFQEEMDAYNQDPDKFTKFKSAGQKPGETQDDRLQLERLRQAGENSRLQQREAAINARQKQAQPKMLAPTQQKAAEQLAIQQLVRTKPEYSAFAPNGQVITPDQLPKAHFYNQVTEAQESLARTQYQQFLSDLDKQKKQITGQGGNQWDIKPDEDEQ